MNWLFIVLSLLWPVVQPSVQQQVQQVQQRMQQRMPQAQPLQPPTAAEQVPQYWFDGQNLYCYWRGQWWIWRGNGSP